MRDDSEKKCRFINIITWKPTKYTGIRAYFLIFKSPAYTNNMHSLHAHLCVLNGSAHTAPCTAHVLSLWCKLIRPVVCLA